MTDLSNLPYRGKWGALLLKYKRNELQKPEVVELLRSDEPVTDEAKSMIADIIANEGKPLKANRPTKWPGGGLTRTSDKSVAETAEIFVRTFAAYIADPSLMDGEDIHPDVRKKFEAAHKRTKYKNRRRTTADAEAKKWVADYLLISERTLYKWLKAVRES